MHVQYRRVHKILSREETEDIFRQQQHWQAKKHGKRAVKDQKKKIPTWTHTFMCLSHTDDNVVPNSQERATLKLTGLGEKKISPHVFVTAQEVYNKLQFQYPRLADGDRFELFCVSDGGGKYLKVIIKASEGGYTVEYSKCQNMHLSIAEGDLDVSPCSTDLVQVACHVM